MKEVNDALLRQFLLGKVDDEVRERMEGLFLTDPAMRERVLAAEQELIEDYLEDSLSGEDKERFVLRYAQTAEQRRKLRITRSIKDWAVTEAGASSSSTSAPVETEKRSRSDAVSFWNRLWRRPVFALSLVAVVVLAVVIGIVGINRWREQRRDSAIEQELARLNSPSSLREMPAGLAELRLSPVTLRGSNSLFELRSGADVRYVDLRLLWSRTEQYQSYQVVVRRIRDGKTFTIRDLQLENGPPKQIRLRLPTHLLSRGTYQIQLNGITLSGRAGATEEYQFTVAG
jgi:negative regulator of sigma E activity